MNEWMTKREITVLAVALQFAALHRRELNEELGDDDHITAHEIDDLCRRLTAKGA